MGLISPKPKTLKLSQRRSCQNILNSQDVISARYGPLHSVGIHWAFFEYRGRPYFREGWERKNLELGSKLLSRSDVDCLPSRKSRPKSTRHQSPAKRALRPPVRAFVHSTAAQDALMSKGEERRPAIVTWFGALQGGCRIAGKVSDCGFG